MITITHTETANGGTITVRGHAGYAEHGKDIVCASISTLTQAFWLKDTPKMVYRSASALSNNELSAVLDFAPVIETVNRDKLTGSEIRDIIKK